uniref:EF-hand domain-containing protein n=1 Tax=Heliothis virescens TaxID=7102 RepID=A0A2A4JFM3_HELVI
MPLAAQGTLERKNIFNDYRQSVDDDEEIRLTNDRDEQYKVADENGFKQLGLVILDSAHKLLTRRNMNIIEDTRDGESTESDTDDDESHSKPRKKKKIERTATKPKPKPKEVKKDTDDEEEEVEVVKKKIEKKVEKKVKLLRTPDSGERDDDSVLRGMNNQCVMDMEKKSDKCTMACFWSHEDVCKRFSCSTRAQSFDIGGNSTESDLEDDDDERNDTKIGLELRAHDKKSNKKSRSRTIPIPPKKRTVAKPNSLRIREEKTVQNERIPRSKCVSEIQMDIEECMRACVRAHEEALIEAKEFLRTGSGDTISIPEDSEDDQSEIMALVILEHADSRESNKSISNENEIMEPWVEHLSPDYDLDSSGEINSDEYQDSDSEVDTSTESSYYHEEDYLNNLSLEDDSKTTKKVETSDYVHEAHVLRKRWRSCQKKASKVCREACVVAYKNSCDEHRCKKKLKKTLKKQCKMSCKDFFL